VQEANLQSLEALAQNQGPVEVGGLSLLGSLALSEVHAFKQGNEPFLLKLPRVEGVATLHCLLLRLRRSLLVLVDIVLQDLDHQNLTVPCPELAWHFKVSPCRESPPPRENAPLEEHLSQLILESNLPPPDEHLMTYVGCSVELPVSFHVLHLATVLEQSCESLNLLELDGLAL